MNTLKRMFAYQAQVVQTFKKGVCVYLQAHGLNRLLMLLLNQQHSSKTIISSFSYPICQRKVFHAKKAEKNNFLSSSQTARESCADETELERRFMFCLVYAVANSHTNLCYLHAASFEFEGVWREFLQGKLESQAQRTFVS